MAVGQRQGIDLALIGGTEPALEVGRPLVVGSRHTRKWAPLINRSAPALHRRNQPGLLENVADRGGGRPTHIGGSAAVAYILLIVVTFVGVTYVNLFRRRATAAV